MDDCLRLNGCQLMVPEVIRGRVTHNQKHNVHTLHAFEDLRQTIEPLNVWLELVH